MINICFRNKNIKYVWRWWSSLKLDTLEYSQWCFYIISIKMDRRGSLFCTIFLNRQTCGHLTFLPGPLPAAGTGQMLTFLSAAVVLSAVWLKQLTSCACWKSDMGRLNERGGSFGAISQLWMKMSQFVMCVGRLFTTAASPQIHLNTQEGGKKHKKETEKKRGGGKCVRNSQLYSSNI